MMPLYVINLGVASLFVDSLFSVFSNFEFITIYVFSIWNNKYLFLIIKKTEPIISPKGNQNTSTIDASKII
jgi:hypothetical protein